MKHARFRRLACLGAVVLTTQALAKVPVVPVPPMLLPGALQASPPPGPGVPHPAGTDVPEAGQAQISPGAEPVARMLPDGRTCELLAGVLNAEGAALNKGGVLLYRRNADTPFLDVKAREDGLVVAHFAARPDEVIQGRAYSSAEPRRNYGKPVPVSCDAKQVALGQPRHALHTGS